MALSNPVRTPTAQGCLGKKHKFSNPVRALILLHILPCFFSYLPPDLKFHAHVRQQKPFSTGSGCTRKLQCGFAHAIKHGSVGSCWRWWFLLQCFFSLVCFVFTLCITLFCSFSSIILFFSLCSGCGRALFRLTGWCINGCGRASVCLLDCSADACVT